MHKTIKISSIFLLVSFSIIFSQFPQVSGVTGYSKYGGAAFPGSLAAKNDHLLDIPPVSEPVKESLYVVGPGDAFKISLVGSIVDESISAEVDPEGILLVPKFGQITTLKPLAFVRREIIDLVKSKTKNVEVTVQLEKTKATQVYISGQLPLAGAHIFDGMARLADVVIRANNDKSDLPGHLSFRNVKIVRANGVTESADLHDFLLNGTAESNPYLFSGDRIIIDQRKLNVLLSGAVARTWSCEWKDETLFELIRFSGGLAANADSTIRVNRFKGDKSGVETFVLKFPEECTGFKVMPEDNVVVSSNPLWRNGITVSINGRVKNPGVYTFPKGSTVGKLIELAGGLVDDADSFTVNLQRPVAVNNFGTSVFRQGVSELDIQTAITLSTENTLLQTASTAILQDGDIISVPRKTDAVSVVGKVVRPGIISHSQGKEWDYYVKHAGGFDKNNYSSYAKVYKKRSNAWVSASDAGIIDAGDIILIPEKPVEYGWNKFKDIVAVTSGILSVAATIIVLGR